MRINDALPIPVAATHFVLPQAGRGALFEDLLTPPDENPGAVRPSPLQHVFGFDALGLLGMGGLPHDQAESRQPSPRAHTAPVVAPIAFSLPVAALPADHDGQAVKPVLPHTATGSPQPGNRVGPAVTRVAADGAVMPAEPGPTLEPATVARPATLSPLRSFTMIEAARDERATAVRARAIRPAMPETSSGQVSVTVSETEGVLHVVAAADLADDVRQKLRDAVREAAHDFGRTVATVTLNGRSIPEPIIMTRSFPWPSQP